tara:strand:- start:254 stop:427 length:174 start_codon:yes stop_codon:yes gene_type:complete
VVVQTEIGRVRSHFPHSDAGKANQNRIIIETGHNDRDNTYFGTIREVNYQGRSRIWR